MGCEEIYLIPVVKNETIQKKLIRIIMASSLVALLLACAAFMGFDLIMFKKIKTRELMMTADLIAENSIAAIEFDDSETGLQIISTLKANPSIEAAAIYVKSRGVFVSFKRDTSSKDAIPEKPLQEGGYLESNSLKVFREFNINANSQIMVYIKSNLREIIQTLKQYLLILVAVLFGSAFIVYILATRLQRRISGPITHLAETAERVAEEKNYSIRATKSSDDELGSLVERFNDMLVQIQHQDAELHEAHDVMEKQVEVRTRELRQEIDVRRKTEEDLISAKEEAEKANNAKSEFLSRMSHELRTPMNAILGFGQLLKMDTKEDNPESRKNFVDQILKAGNHLLELINEVLDLSRIESGTMTLSIEGIAVNDLIEEVLVLINPLAETRNIDVSNRIPESENLVIQADRTRVKQILLNLLSNAVKYNKEYGSVSLGGFKTDEDTIRLQVTDTGKGIPLEKQMELFEPFQRLGEENSGIEGTGIGLTITKRLVELMGGSIHLESEEGKGSTFFIEFPQGILTTTPRGIKSDSMPENPEGDLPVPKVILYVEDNPANFELVRQVLVKRPKLSLVNATQAEKGLELAEKIRPDLIFMDINLPGMDGLEAFKELQKKESTKDIPVVALSANAMDSDISKAMGMGFKDYIVKPIDVKNFLNLVDGLVLS